MAPKSGRSEQIRSSARSPATTRKTRVWRSSQALALRAEASRTAYESNARRWELDSLYLRYEELVPGSLCRACLRPLVGGLTECVDAAGPFIEAHRQCSGLWRLEGCATRHCSQCCPPPPLSPAQLQALSALPPPPPPDSLCILKFTCAHRTVVLIVATSFPPTTGPCGDCKANRGVVEARLVTYHGSDDSPPGAREVAAPSDRMSNTQWRRIQAHEAFASNSRGRPLSDARTIVDGIQFRELHGIPWRSLPTAFGPWQTVARWHRRLLSSGAWMEIAESLQRTRPR